MKNDEKSISRRKFFKLSSLGIGGATGFSLLSRCSEGINAANSVGQDEPPAINGDGNRDGKQAGHRPHNNMIARRNLGKTGMEVSLLAFGGGSQFMKNEDGDWEQILERAVEAGVNYFDTANNYSGGDSEIRYGKILNKYREQVYVATKLESRGVDGSREQFEDCLNRLKMDYVDVLLIHAVDKNDNLSELENGVYKTIAQCKSEGIAKFIGFSVMNESDIPVAKSVIENLDIDVVLGVINPMGRYGNCADLLPVTKEKNIGFLAMKTVRQLVNAQTTAKELISYALDKENVSAAVIGHHGIDKLEENISIVNEYATDTSVPYDWGALERRINKYVENRKPVWTLPGYHDGMMV
ncbi:hypothetical protein GF337_05820 [candidate division KSB1 bacterium]|nr:hypothetical protein [candidate division KSB1 bacterium]